MLFGSNLLEVAIGVVFVYLLLSLLCSAFSELIESFIRFRARDLEKGIARLLDDPSLKDDPSRKGTPGLKDRLFQHPLIRPLGDRPSYIPARTFSLALWNIATTEAAKAKGTVVGVTQELDTIRNLITSLNDPKYEKIKTSLITLIDEAGNDINRARTNIEDWYNDAMDRVSGWYKRRTHWMLLTIGLIAAAFLNVDTINVTRALWYNDTLRSSVVTAADNYIKTQPAPQTESSSTKTDNPEAQAKAALDKVKNVQAEINSLGLPIGWVSMPKTDDAKYNKDNAAQDKAGYERDRAAYENDPRRLPANGYAWFLKLLGIVFTALAVSQGAPFWFDLLNKFMVVRSTIKPHEKSREESSKDKTASETRK